MFLTLPVSKGGFMSYRRGITVLDFILPAGVETFLPSELRQFLEKLAVVDLKSAVSEKTYVHHGTVLPLENALPFLSKLGDLGKGWELEFPGLNTGAVFQFTEKRAEQDGSQNLEPGADKYQLNLLFNTIRLKIPKLKPAKLITLPTGLTRMEPDTYLGGVWLEGGGVLRISWGSNQEVDVRLVELPDPFDPDVPTGPVFRLTFNPPHFFVGGSRFGLTVDSLTWDHSKEYTPQEIMARGHGEEWRGLSLDEAALRLNITSSSVTDLYIGIKDLIIGTPLGLQGEINLQMGRLDIQDQYPIHFYLKSSPNTPLVQHDDPNNSGQKLIKLDNFNTPVMGKIDNTVATWVLPAKTAEKQTASVPQKTIDGKAKTDFFYVKPHDIVKVTPLFTDANNKRSALPVRYFQFVQTQGTAPPQEKLKLNIELNTNISINEVASISGTQEHLKKIIFRATPQSTNIAWASDISPYAGKGHEYRLKSLPNSGQHHVGAAANSDVRRCRIEIIKKGYLIIGHKGGFEVYDDKFAKMTNATIKSLEAVYSLSPFYTSNLLRPASKDKAKLINNNQAVEVQKDALAKVRLGFTANPPKVPIYEPVARLEMNFDETAFSRLVLNIDGKEQSFTTNWKDELAKFFNAFETVDDPNTSEKEEIKSILIARCCDIGSYNYNEGLARERLAAGSSMVCQAGVDETNLLKKCEFDPWEQKFATLNSLAETEVPPAHQEGWLVKKEHCPNQIPCSTNDPGKTRGCECWPTANQFPPPPEQKNKAERIPYRGVYIYAIGKNKSKKTTIDPEDRDVYIPGEPQIKTESKKTKEKPDKASKDWFGSLRVVWDSPTVVDWADAIPTLAEVQVAWEAGPLPLPQGSSVAPGNEVYKAMLRWAYDPRTGQTGITASFESTNDPNGLFPPWESDIFALALFLLPVLASRLSKKPDSSSVALGALLTAGIIGELAGDIIKEGKIIFKKIEASWQQAALTSTEDWHVKLITDYVVQFKVDVKIGGKTLISSGKNPLKVLCKGCGIEFGDTPGAPWYDNFGLIHKDISMEIKDSADFKIEGVLGKLLRIAGTRLGSGSTWFELDMAVGLDLGVISLSEATIRVTFKEQDTSVSLRGLKAGINIAEVFKGEGTLKLGDQGEIGASLKIEIIPAGVKGTGTLQFKDEFVEVAGSVRFPVGIPLYASGLAIYGFAGRFVSNGTRDIADNPDLIKKELDWYKKTLKYKPEHGQFALGFGMVIGTLPDSGFTFNAEGSLAVEFPDISVVFGVKANLVNKKPKEKETGDTQTADLIGVVSVDISSVKIGILGKYEIKKLIRIVIPLSAYFPLEGDTRDYYFRIGSDGQEDRAGEPITIEIFPGTPLSRKCWAYLMIEGDKLHNLGGRGSDGFNFDGFSIGFGTGFEVKWGGGCVRLSASASLLAGLGTNPLTLAAGIFFKGELKIIVIVISISADLIYVYIKDGGHYLKGKICGKVDLGFFSVKGCVSFKIGDEDVESIPAPTPLQGMTITDRTGIVRGESRPGEENRLPDLTQENSVLPDAVALLHFSQYILADSVTTNFTITSCQPVGSPWNGSSELKYAYNLHTLGVESVVAQGDEIVSVTPLVIVNGYDLEAGWWWPADRPALYHPADNPASEQEGRHLALFSWRPDVWAKNLIDGGEGLPGDPKETLTTVCEPTTRSVKYCVLGRLAERIDSDLVILKGQYQEDRPATSYFQVQGKMEWGKMNLEEALDLCVMFGLDFYPGKKRSLGGVCTVDGTQYSMMYRLPMAFYQGDGTLLACSFDLKGDFNPSVVSPSLILAVKKYDRRSKGLYEYLPRSLIQDYDLEYEKGPVPTVTGIISGGTEIEWNATKVGSTSLYDLYRCAPKVRIRKKWKGFRIGSFEGEAGIVSVCAKTWITEWIENEDQNSRKEILEDLNSRTEEEFAPHEFLLQPDTIYRVRVAWQGAVYKKEEGEAESLPPVEEIHWQNPQTEYFYFKTASALDMEEIKPYLLGFEPNEESCPHFLDDPVRVHFSVHYLEQLLNLYGYELEVRVQKTTWAAGELAGEESTPSESFSGELLIWEPLPEELQERANINLQEALRASPCIEGEISLDGASLTIHPELEPDAEYDLLLLAVKNEEKIIIAQTHFKTSRYRNAGKMIEALGFGLHITEKRPLYPHDVIVETGTMPTDVVLSSDKDLESVLLDLGLDLWPLASEPRATAIWQTDATAWRFIGLLLEGPEPLLRINKRGEQEWHSLDLIHGRIYSSQPLSYPVYLSLVRSNHSGTRVLLAPPEPRLLSAGWDYTLYLRFREKKKPQDTGIILSAYRYFNGEPNYG